MKLIQTVCEKLQSLLRFDPFESWWNQRKYETFSELLPKGDHTFGQFQIECEGNKFNVWFKDIELLDSESNYGAIFSSRRKYYWYWRGPFQQDFINFIDEYIARKTAEDKLASDARRNAKLATLMLYVPGKVIF